MVTLPIKNLSPLLSKLSSYNNTNHSINSLTERLEQVNARITPTIRVEQAEHGCLIVWLTRSDKRNALSFEMMDQLIWLAKHISQWRDIRSVILTGEGASFCAGIDLADLNNPKNLSTVAWELIKPWQSKFQQVCLIWRALPMPVLSVLQGHCLGAGLQLALASDIRLASHDCQFAIMEAKWGLVADMGLTQSSFGQLRPDVVKELTMTARMFDSEQALHYGVITHLSDDPMTDAIQLAAELAMRSPDAVLAAKRIINASYQQSALTVYQEKSWQIKMLLGKNRKLAVKKAKDSAVDFLSRQFG